ncbi:hypothetical protein GW17_00059985 [Ensete ventricosum]|nr:hypothetical protein GW17_00059985 [Ensete ventricosum]
MREINYTQSVVMVGSSVVTVLWRWQSSLLGEGVHVTLSTLFIFLSMTCSLTYPFDVLVEAIADATSPRFSLNLQSSTLDATYLLAPNCSSRLLLGTRTLIHPAASTHQ